MAKFKAGDKVTVHYSTYVENGTVVSAHEITPQLSDYLVQFSDGTTDVCDENELTANP